MIIHADASPAEKTLSAGSLDGAVATADIRRELFEGENVVLKKDGDHGPSELTNKVASSGKRTVPRSRGAMILFYSLIV